jgi:amphi-Trp domain-containing protein
VILLTGNRREQSYAPNRRVEMGKERKIFKSEENKSLDQVSGFLRELAEKMASGQIVLRQGQEEIVLTLPANLVLEIQVEEEDKGQARIQHSLEIEVKWFDGEEGGGSVELG